MRVCNGKHYTYDKNGSLTSRGADTFEYDILGNLLAATVNGTTVTYAVDAENRRVGRTVNGVTTRYVYEDQVRIAAELDAAGNMVSQFYYRNSPNAPEMMWKNGVWYRVVTDHLGSVRQVIDEATGAVVFAATYSAWGERTVTLGSANFIPHGFAGGLHDVTTGLVRFGARDYDPATGRWTAKDAAGFDVAGTNLYKYSGNDPINFLDSTGFSCVLGEPFGVVWEVGFVGGWTAGRDAQGAGNAAAGFGEDPGGEDALRHCIASCRITKDLGLDDAHALGELHEECHPNASAQREMDEHNNAVGRHLGQYDEDCVDACKDALDHCELETDNP
jgi:RHS repeat-associated protein